MRKIKDITKISKIRYWHPLDIWHWYQDQPAQARKLVAFVPAMDYLGLKQFYSKSITKKDLDFILDSLLECYELIENNSRGISLHEKYLARLILIKYGRLQAPVKKADVLFRKRKKSSGRSKTSN